MNSKKPNTRDRLVRLTLASANHSHVLNSLIVYYWFLLFFGRQDEESIQRFSVLYFALVVPINLYVLFALRYLFLFKWKPYVKALLCYWLLVSTVSIFRLDIATLYNVTIFCLPIITIINSNFKLSTTLLNRLFLLSILGSAITFYWGNNVFGLIPGQALSSESQGLQWRVSLFPMLSESVSFSLLIVLINLLFNKGRRRLLYCVLGLYFVLLGGNRTTIIALLFISAFLICIKYITLNRDRFYKLLLPAMLLLLVAVVNIDLFALPLANINNSFVNNYIFRSESGAQSTEDLTKTIYRGWLWQQHLRIFLSKPLFGVGTFVLDNYVDSPLVPGAEGIGSESLLTLWLARVGLLIMPFFVFFYRVYSKAIQDQNKFAYALCIMLMVFSLGYASFLVPYNCLFLMMFGSINLHAETNLVPSRSSHEIPEAVLATRTAIQPGSAI